MDQTEKQKQKQSLSQFHRKLTRLLLSVSIFSLFFSHSLFHSLNSTFHDTLAFKFLSHNIEKNFIFLLCNGLLVFLAKFSGLISSSSKHNNDHQSFKSYEYVTQTESTSLDPKTPLLEKEENAGLDEEELKRASVDEPFVEEMNKRFDEFIRKVKEELSTEA
ncbi:hypothetical protein ES319_D05G422000v1 [Gossypium barbadense]|uniref:Uncharacterized protein n=4 Tax=Gossypium TaxID=3633 RepID=A0A0D2U4X6_GOSRA|nr:uncharacterized protein LOC128041173 [Gossypium raimondii]KAB2033055.1 hypothetical protein ES319_D05G422000v1 [Gossypium barbadense]KJB63001.1 hypothetical protein B456_009G449500 [Gossypium raimondii]TYG72108.1 hypothetical protein ES288_D05G453500v1 [Gossypium darwinii]TYH75057.1 hypothetical protein ES332_D05G447400v1 [Gossypium tomentosum]